MSGFTIYDTTTGCIAQSMHNRGDVSAVESALQPGQSFIEEASDNVTGQYVLDGELMDKQDYTIKTLPMPCTITIEGSEYHLTEQPTFNFDEVGVYDIAVDAGVGFLKKTFQVEHL